MAKQFHISDVLSITTGRLVSTRHMQGVYEILNFLTGDQLFTHQLPRAQRECEPWLRTQFPQLMADSPAMQRSLEELDKMLALDKGDNPSREKTILQWLECIKTHFQLPEMLNVFELGADMHTRIDPIEELEAMVGPAKIIVIE